MSIDSPYIPISGKSQPKLQNSTLILPTISIGNLPQLTIDLLIHNYNFIKIGYLNDLYLYPFASPIDYVKNPIEGISHAIEVYYCEELNITLIQQRSPIIPSYSSSFLKEVIIPFITESDFLKIIILNSNDSGIVENIQNGDIIIYDNQDLLSNFKNLTISKSIEEQDKNSIFITKLLKLLEDLENVNVKVLVSYIYEGDNFQDAEKMINKLIKNLDIEINNKNWVKPVSWLGAYGDKEVPNSMEEGIFG
ncbi:hypothetical protein KGF54_003198 [Candida jiufengensis]|uniref:uncharacterized protein n=1 Tax=Candida jiufengensis TaxID=497108 RepID=UPI002224E773|nr:uncharacterized protein KGF54_003198 [Candida jiufengensis]KAI5952332.1 hypothetical protein KGF54_003198 [Candida jiufengensis]